MRDARGEAARGPGARPRAGAALCAVLAALLHVLGCAHGPVLGAPPSGVAAGLVVSAAPAPPGAPAGDRAGRASHGAASCADADEPSVLPQRTELTAAPAADRPLPLDTAEPEEAAPPGWHSCGPGSGPGGYGTAGEQRRRAALGVWRN
ncbi:hypothetical protein AB0O07_07495 [Streptomyces sp. NPDC093085]|uniref:hypothetical protein n=1 Tax=Streptomyces sp. NPDC093085 TaxID=3155068 RepID=UPI003415B026